MDICYFVAVFSLVVVHIGLSLACHCQTDDKHPQQHYCDAKFVIEATISGSYTKPSRTAPYPFPYQPYFHGQAYGGAEAPPPPGSDYPSDAANMGLNTRYQLSHVKVLKDSGYPAPEYVYTNEFIHCGASLSVGDKYIIMGHIALSKYYTTTSCTFNKQWNSITKTQKSGFKGAYQENCGTCNAVFCMPGSCPQCCDNVVSDKKKDDCIFHLPSYFTQSMYAQITKEKNCLAEKSLCEKKGRSCKWSNKSCTKKSKN